MPTPKKAYCFTLNNYTEDECSAIIRVCETESRYAIFGYEVGESGTPHLQGYIIFKRSYRFKTIKDRFLPRCHIEIAAGSAHRNHAYCSKGGNFREFHELPPDSKEGGTREEVARRFADACGSGLPGVRSFAESDPGTWYYSGHNLLRNYLTLQPTVERPNINVQWYFGPPGVGKSRRAHDEYPDAYIKEPRTKWWNGYMLEKEVIIDDFGPGGIDINHLLRWFDRYKCLVENKGGMIPLYAERFIVTSNYHPRQVFSFAGEEHVQLPALLRRLIIIELNGV